MMLAFLSPADVRSNFKLRLPPEGGVSPNA
jgi:hypothetical protein